MQNMSFSAKSVNGTEYSITRAALYFCLLAFPFIMLYAGMERFFTLEFSDRRAELFDQAGKQLLKFGEYAEDERFFHLLLQKKIASSHVSNNITQQLKKNETSCKKLIPTYSPSCSGTKKATQSILYQTRHGSVSLPKN